MLFKVQIDTTHIEQGNVNIEKLIWDPSRAQEFKEKMQLETRALNNIVDGIISNNADLLIHLILFYLYVCNDLYQPPLIMGEKHVLCLDLINLT